MQHLDNADGLPGEVEAGVQQEGENQGKGLVPAQKRQTAEGSNEHHKRFFLIRVAP